jgi:hypothetical protein
MENVLRKQMVADAVNRGAGSPITIEFVAKFLPDDFELGTDDLAPYMAAEAEPEAEAPFDWNALGEQVDRVREKRLAAQAGQTAPTEQEAEALGEQEAAAFNSHRERQRAPVTADDIGAAMTRRLAADALVNNSRVTLITAQNVEKDARIKLADSIIQFQSGFDKLTPEQLRRDHVKEQAAIRQAQKDGTLPMRLGPGIGKSAVDRAAYFSKFGHGAGAGGGGAYRRGAYSSNERGTLNTDPRRGAVAKLPSER